METNGCKRQPEQVTCRKRLWPDEECDFCICVLSCVNKKWLIDWLIDIRDVVFLFHGLEMIMGMRFPMGIGIKFQKMEWLLFPWEEIPTHFNVVLVSLFVHRLRYSTVTNWHNILKDMTVVFNGAAFLLLDCRLFAFTLYCFAVSVWECEWPSENAVGVGMMGIRLKLGNEWELTAQERGEWECTNLGLFPFVSSQVA